jgi:hypothetical protein
MGWWNDDGPECRRCGEPTAGCPECKGEGSVAGLLGRIECNACNGTKWQEERPRQVLDLVGAQRCRGRLRNSTKPERRPPSAPWRDMGTYDGQDQAMHLATRRFLEHELKREQDRYERINGKPAEFYDGISKNIQDARNEVAAIDRALQALRDAYQ